MGPFSYLKTVANGGKIQNTVNAFGQLPVPADLIFSTDINGTNLLNWEITQYDPTTGDIEVWVKVPTISHSIDTVVYMTYGNAAIATYQGGAFGSPWDANFNCVQHFPTLGGLLYMIDSTTNGVNGTNHGSTPVAGKIDGGVQANNIITFPDSALTRPFPITFSLWFNFQVQGVNYNRIFQKGNDGSAPFASYGILYNAADQTSISGIFGFTDLSDDAWTSPAGTFAAGTWYKIDGTFDGANVIFYMNGLAVYTHANTKTLSYDATTLALGGPPSGNGNFNGIYDEFRLSKVARSADWLITEYNSQNNPAAFMAVGSELPPPGSSVIAGRRTFGFPGTRTGSRQMQ